MLGVGFDLDGSAADGVFHAKAVDRSRVVVANFFLLGVEAHTLTDYDGVGFAVRAPYGEGHLEAHDERTCCVEVARARAERVLPRDLVSGC